MGVVTEYLDAYPIADEAPIELQRDEELLFGKAQVGPIRLLQHELLGAVHFPVEFVPARFSPPRGIYECDHIRLEWQQMGNFRQPFYHRNADVDEVSYQIFGDRTLMTEHGTVEIRPGDYSRIPVGVGHDNYGRNEIHLLFYIPASVTECGPFAKKASHTIPPFEGWESKVVAEVMTECLGGPECDIASFQVDETLLLNHAKGLPEDKLISILRPTEASKGDIEWKYKSKHVWIGHTELSKSTGTPKYRRHRRAEEIQCQISGTRTVITQRGIITLEPGDFISIPNGVAFTDHVTDNSTHITVLTFNKAEAKGDIVKRAKPATTEAIAELRHV